MISSLSIWMKLYILFYSLLTSISFIIIVLKRKEFGFLTGDYFKFLFTRERISIYAIGTIALIIPAHFMELHSWDYSIAVFQPILAFLSAPWAVEVFCQFEQKKAKAIEVFTALCLMMFTGSWSVEIYLLLRDGYYMPDWLINIPIGIVCYLIMGTLWNVEWKPKST